MGRGAPRRSGRPAVGRRFADFSPDSIEPSEELTLYDCEHRVEIELTKATKLIGTLLDSAPVDRTRVIDHLNRAGRFVRLWTADEHFLINTTQIVAVTELGEAKYWQSSTSIRAVSSSSAPRAPC